MLPTVLVRRADCPQCVGSVLPSDSRLGSACTVEASLSHWATLLIGFGLWLPNLDLWYKQLWNDQFLRIDLVCGDTSLLFWRASKMPSFTQGRRNNNALPSSSHLAVLPTHWCWYLRDSLVVLSSERQGNPTLRLQAPSKWQTTPIESPNKAKQQPSSWRSLIPFDGHFTTCM